MRKQIARVQTLTEMLQDALIEKLEYDAKMKAYEVEYEKMLEKEDSEGYKWISKPSGISNAEIKRVGLMLRQEMIELEKVLTVVY